MTHPNPINFQPLEQKLSSLFNFQNFKIEWLEGQHKPQIKHDSLLSLCGVFNLAISELSVDFFNFSDNPETTLWGTICLFYSSHSRGSNGMEIMSVWYDHQTTEWTFIMENKSM